jgi:hypothetical protein
MLDAMLRSVHGRNKCTIATAWHGININTSSISHCMINTAHQMRQHIHRMAHHGHYTPHYCTSTSHTMIPLNNKDAMRPHHVALNKHCIQHVACSTHTCKTSAINNGNHHIPHGTQVMYTVVRHWHRVLHATHVTHTMRALHTHAQHTDINYEHNGHNSHVGQRRRFNIKTTYCTAYMSYTHRYSYDMHAWFKTSLSGFLLSKNRRRSRNFINYI